MPGFTSSAHRGNTRECFPLPKKSQKSGVGFSPTGTGNTPTASKSSRRCITAWATTPRPWSSISRRFDLRRKLLGENHPDYARSLYDVANGYYDTRDYPTAVKLHQQALDLRRKLLGENHTDYARSLHSLAIAYDSMGDYAKALELNQQALNLRRKLLGENHLDYARSLGNMAVYHQHMRDYPIALELQQQSLTLRKKLVGENHLEYASSVFNLAGVYFEMGDSPKALAFISRRSTCAGSYWVRTTRTTPEASTTWRVCISTWATTPRRWRFISRALPARKLLGENHPEYAQSLNNLACVLGGWRLPQGIGALSAGAEPAQKAVGREPPRLRPKPPRPSECLPGDGRLPQGIGALSAALNLRKKLLGENHPDYVNSLGNMAVAYAAMGNDSKALQLHQQASEHCKKCYGEQHPAYAESLCTLAHQLRSMGEYERSLTILKKACDIYDKTKSEEEFNGHSYCLAEMAFVCIDQGNPAKALPFLEKFRSIYDKRNYGDSESDMRIICAFGYRASFSGESRPIPQIDAANSRI